MEQKIRCIYRKKKCFHICNKTAIKNSFYCCFHIHSKKKHLCKIFFNILEERYEPTFNDIYKIYIYILENTTDNDDLFINIFIDLLKMIPLEKLSNIYRRYIHNYAIIDVGNVSNVSDVNDVIVHNKKNTKAAKAAKAADDIYSKIYMLNRDTYIFSKKCNLNILIDFQNIVKYKLLSKQNDNGNNYLNNDDVFSLENINNIHPHKLFIIKDTKGSYAFDIVELEYFVRKCLRENVPPYNPYTRELLRDNIIWRLNMKIKYYNITKKNDDCRWTTDMNAYTDLSIEIERRGFYNNPEWFKKMSKKDLLKCIKLFKDFSSIIEESKRYFLNINDDTFIYDFCKEGIKLFSECNDDLYILCCNFMKSLALCSNEFYNNIPEWLSTYETTSYISSLTDFTTLISTLINNNTNTNGHSHIHSLNNTNINSTINTNINNLPNLNYEYMNDVNSSNEYNFTNFGIGDDLLNNRVNNILSANDESNLTHSNYNNDIDINNLPNTTINPSNNFLLYYYVEYM